MGKAMITDKEAETIKKIDAMFELDILKIWVDYCEKKTIVPLASLAMRAINWEMRMQQ